MKCPIEIAKEKFAKNKDITPCKVVARGKTNMCGVIYKSEFFSDCYLDDMEGETAYVIEDEDGKGINLFTPNGTFATWMRRGGALAIKVEVIFVNVKAKKCLNF